MLNVAKIKCRIDETSSMYICRWIAVGERAIVEAGLSFKLDFTFSIFNENFGDDVLEGFMYMYNILTI